MLLSVLWKCLWGLLTSRIVLKIISCIHILYHILDFVEQKKTRFTMGRPYIMYMLPIFRARQNGRPIVRNAILALSNKWLSLDTRPMDEQIIIAQMSFINLGQVHIWFRTNFTATSDLILSIPLLLMHWRLEPGYQQAWYRPPKPQYFISSFRIQSSATITRATITRMPV